jgi:hypothetical protein
MGIAPAARFESLGIKILTFCKVMTQRMRRMSPLWVESGQLPSDVVPPAQSPNIAAIDGYAYLSYFESARVDGQM